MENYFEFFEHKKSFNTTGSCNKEKHYMVNIDIKLRQIIKLIQQEKYFVINRPRQFGKTTTLNELHKILKTRYKVIKLNFEGIGEVFSNEKSFCKYFSANIKDKIGKKIELVDNFIDLSNLIKKVSISEEIILIIDEVDKTSNEKLFLEFLGMLRALFLERANDEAKTFKSVILCGVHDIRNLKLKFSENTRYNSPWNIASEFSIDMSFNEEEIKSMLDSYSKDNNLYLKVDDLSKEIYKFSSGYPFLVSRICQIVDETILENKNWSKKDIQMAIKKLIEENNTLFDDLIKNIENNKQLYNYMYEILILRDIKIFNIDNPVINLGYIYGYFNKDENNNVCICNQIIKERIYNYLVSKSYNQKMSNYNFKEHFITDDNGLDMEKIMIKFSDFMKQNYNSKDKEFLERQGVLLFLAFIKPIINGVGFDYKEVQISEEKRLDVVIEYNNHKYIVEAKLWRGEISHKKGLNQLKEYLDINGLDKGYLLIFNFNKNKEFKSSSYRVDNKIIFETIV